VPQLAGTYSSEPAPGMADTVNSRLEVWQLNGVELKDGLPDPTCLSWRPHLFALPRAIFRLVPQEDRGLSPSQGTLRSRGLHRQSKTLSARLDVCERARVRRNAPGPALRP
jgi:hypothetical protein